MRAQADRDGKHCAFAEKYEGSDLRRRNARALAEHMTDSAEVPPQLLAELAIKRETSNPWYWGVWTLLQVGCCPAACMQACMHACVPLAPLTLLLAAACSKSWMCLHASICRAGTVAAMSHDTMACMREGPA